jgi:hypothetical protein
VTPTLADLAREPTRVAELPVEAIPALLAQLAGVQTALAAHLASCGARSTLANDGKPDQLLTIEQASDRLKISKDWLYRHASKLPFTVRPSPRQLRFSEGGIERYIRRRS